MILPCRICWFWIALLAICAGCNSGNNDSQGSAFEASNEPAASGSPDSIAPSESRGPSIPRGPSVPRGAAASLEPTDSAGQLADRDRLLEKVDQLVEGGQTGEAITTLEQLLVGNPADAEVLFRLAILCAADGDLSRGLEFLSEIPTDHPEAGLPALGQSADWCFQLERFDEAETLYRRVLDRAPDSSRVHRQLAYLYNRQGRRHEAAEHVRALCRLGDVRQDELHSLIVLGDAMYDDPKAEAVAGERPYWPIGPSASARRLFNQQRYEQALQLLDEVLEGERTPASVIAFYGRVAVEAQDEEAFRKWIAHDSDSLKKHADYWAAIGTYLLGERRFDEAARALIEAIDRDPTDLISIGRLQQAMRVVGDPASAQLWESRWEAVRDVLRSNNRISGTDQESLQAMAELAEQLFVLDRKLEAVMWKSIEGTYTGITPEQRQMLNAQRQQLVATETGFPSSGQRIAGLNRNRFPMPNLDAGSLKASSPNGDQVTGVPSRRSTPARFENVAKDAGVRHSFAVASKPQDSGYSIYQLLGGGVAVIDYDLDGLPDLHFAQGAAEPPEFNSAAANPLLRNVGDRFVSVEAFAGTRGDSYTIGLTSGDWNQDGFPDLVVSNIGNDLLLINNGDGTFAGKVLIKDQQRTRIPTSAAVADLTGDSLPDFFQVAYVDDQSIAKKPNRNLAGEVIKAMVPTDFAPGADRLVANDGAGGFLPSSWNEKDRADSSGLGLIVTDLNGEPGNELFVGNDLRPNQLWVRQQTGGEDGAKVWVDVAGVLGCGFSYTGRATASMGIAAGDFDGTGTLDLHVTNFQQESASLFLSANGTFRDRNRQFGINSESRAVLGFGTQSLDYDNDGMLDLVVTNGHIDRESGSVAPFKQPPQLFANEGNRFRLTEVDDSSGYWSTNHLGRALARLDFNRDGLPDFVVTHVEAPTSLMLNRTQTDNHWLQVSLVGTQSERDAIGAKVEVRGGDRRWTGWVIAGDGYLSRNETSLAFGLGAVERVDEIVVTWPGGKTQTFTEKIPVDNRLLLIEGLPSASPFGSKTP